MITVTTFAADLRGRVGRSRDVRDVRGQRRLREGFCDPAAFALEAFGAGRSRNLRGTFAAGSPNVRGGAVTLRYRAPARVGVPPVLCDHERVGVPRAPALAADGTRTTQDFSADPAVADLSGQLGWITRLGGIYVPPTLAKGGASERTGPVLELETPANNAGSQQWVSRGQSARRSETASVAMNPAKFGWRDLRPIQAGKRVYR